MDRITSTLFFLLISSFVFAQEIDLSDFEKIDKLIIQNKLKQVKSSLDKLEKTKNLSIINLHKIYEYKIKVASIKNNQEREYELMTMYLFNTNLDSVLSKNKNPNFFDLRNDTVRIYRNKSVYSIQLAKYYQAKKDYSKAMKFLNIHEAKYLYRHPCGTGRATDNLKRQIMSGEIYQKLGNHSMVFKKLLPLTFEHSTMAARGLYEKKVDSILIVSLNLKYTKKQILNEFKRAIKSIPDEEPNIHSKHLTEIKMFDILFSIHAIKRYQYIEERKRETINIKDNEERKKIKKNIYVESYKKAFQTNRIYKILS